MQFSAEQAREVGEQIGIQWDEVEFDSEQLAHGMEVELEHGSALGDGTNITSDDPEQTAKIAWAHLLESPDYYTMLATMEDELMGTETEDTRSRASRARDAYMETKQPVSSPTTKTSVEISPALKSLQQKYLKQVVQRIEQGKSTDDAFQQRPDLDDFSPEQLLDLLLENPQLAKRQISTLGPAAQYGDIFDAMQTTLELAVWESSIQWWGQQRTKEQTQEKAQQDRKNIETVVETPQGKAATTAMYRFRGRWYQEL